MLNNAAIAVDAVVFGYRERLEILLVRRGIEPWSGAWALPGGFVHDDEDLDAAVVRELHEETGLRGVALEQLRAFGAPGRDPRGRVVTVAYLALVPPRPASAGTDAAAAKWFSTEELPELAFDHANIVALARDELRRRARRAPVGFELLPPDFTFAELQALYEALLGEPLDKRNFRKKLLSTGLLVPRAERRGSTGRPAGLWSFDRARHDALADAGFEFRI